ncbi:MAG: hypothetical protein Q8S73_41125 [Deltaproteobacteria bacterium]|nr:hypothetical protein [Myxococcales bacterium]MDP3220567.1 hypothetical protein [Deltaproteobacteria bacterium]
MANPSTLPALRDAVARVLTACGEAHDGLTVTLEQVGDGRVGVHIRGCFTLAMWMPAPDEAEAIDRAWRTVLLRLDDGRASAAREVARAEARQRAAADGVSDARRDLRRAQLALRGAEEVTRG